MREYDAHLKTQAGEYTIVRVDRAEPNKNIIRGFRAFDLLLAQHPELRGKVKFLVFLVPSRPHIRQYQHYTEDILSLVQQLNAKYGTQEWQPITIFHENNYLQALAGMKLYDVLLVNPVVDGMNLVAKEGPLVNERNGVVVLSETAGAYEQLKKHVLPVSPADLEGTMQALYAALLMGPNERQERARAIKATVECEDTRHWLQCQLEDLLTIIRTKRASGPATDPSA
jgi:trehalose 6-phosphate synthase